MIARQQRKHSSGYIIGDQEILCAVCNHVYGCLSGLLCILVFGCSGITIIGSTTSDIEVDSDIADDGMIEDIISSDTSGFDWTDWNVHGDNISDIPWRDNDEVFCRPPDRELIGWDVWSDSRGVFAMVQELSTLGFTCPPVTPEESPGSFFLAFNDGTGWLPYFRSYSCPPAPPCWNALTGNPNGVLAVVTSSVFCEPHETAEDGSLVLVPFIVRDMYIVNDNLAYSILDSGVLMLFNGEEWGPYPPDPLPHDVNLIWADEEALFVAGDAGLVMSHEDEGWVVHDTMIMDDITTIWGFRNDDVWVGTYSGRILHWNGISWEEMDWPRASSGCSSHERIIEMWGSSGIVYFHTAHDVVVWDGSIMTNILAYDCSHAVQEVNGLWGNAWNEVFFSVNDELVESPECDSLFLLWWDGISFHWL